MAERRGEEGIDERTNGICFCVKGGERGEIGCLGLMSAAVRFLSSAKVKRNNK
jgi:hypothetical protein